MCYMGAPSLRKVIQKTVGHYEPYIVILWVVGMNTHPMKNHIYMAKIMAPKLPFQSLMKFFRLQATTLSRQVKYYFTFRYFINQFPFFWFSR